MPRYTSLTSLQNQPANSSSPTIQHMASPTIPLDKIPSPDQYSYAPERYLHYLITHMPATLFHPVLVLYQHSKYPLPPRSLGL